ncbi:MAG: transglutaminase domain-containing protein [Candidatus Eremiobacteraeota bacterium]|nr:transglutaminase domain-containing protein [Candidatus Eremiobacteraeota bacterium]MCW5867918.1 transglutaminase domain-containing protein [Candidatus Eremiobacteraeota bacterium]
MKPLDWPGALTILLPWLALLMLNADAFTISLTVAACLLALARGRWNVSRTWWLLWSLVGVAAFVAMFRSDARRALGSGLVYANLYPVALSLGWASLPALVRRHTRGQYWMAMTLSGLFFLITGLNLMPLSIQFGVMSCLWMVLFGVSSRTFLTNTRPNLAAWLTLIPTCALMAVLAVIFTYSEVQFGFLMRLLSAGNDIGLTFPAQNRLNSMMSSETNPAVVARCFSQRPNTYLAARVYTKYQEGTWTEFGPSENTTGTQAAGAYRYTISDLKEGLTVERFEVHASPIVLFHPRDTVWIECQEPQLAQLSGHLLEQRGGGNGLQAYMVARKPGQDLAPPESPEYLKACLQLPENLDPIVAQTARQVLTGRPGTDIWKRSLQCQIWFQSNFEYGFGYDFSKAKDPVVDFLTNKPAAHCELFAASMTLMLRTQGIPARYVNGFVCVEQAYSQDYYVVRVRDAHAWVEVWDGKAWRTLDPTPPSAIQPPQGWGSWFDKMREAFNYYTRDLGKLDWRAVLAALWDRRAYWFSLLLLYVLWRIRKAEWFPRLQGKSAQTPQSEWIRTLSRVLEAKNLARHEWETLLHWAERLEDQEASDWLRDYSAYRYGGAIENNLADRLRNLVKRLQNPTS